mmetsp:Transcript_69738/g.130209  ORF Transcript_69738/g.130209 Transcript_69738/m.130209 type:complete len:241 (+) Transcript_69738:382-1104(+)
MRSLMSPPSIRPMSGRGFLPMSSQYRLNLSTRGAGAPFCRGLPSTISPATDVHVYAPKSTSGKPPWTVNTAGSPSSPPLTSIQRHCLAKPNLCKGLKPPPQTTSQRPLIPSRSLRGCGAAMCPSSTPSIMASTTAGMPGLEPDCLPCSFSRASRMAADAPPGFETCLTSSASANLACCRSTCESRMVAAKSNQGKTRVKSSKRSEIVRVSSPSFTGDLFVADPSLLPSGAAHHLRRNFRR